MNSSQFAVNAKSLENLKSTKSRQFFGAFLLEVVAAMPIDKTRTYAENKKRAYLQTKENQNLSLQDLAENDLIAFTIKLVSPVTYTSHSHRLLALQNEHAQEFDVTFTAYANMETIEFAEQEFLGQAINPTELHEAVKRFVAQSKDVTRIANVWRKQKSAYQVFIKGNWIAFEPKTQESENLAPMVTPETPETPETPVTYVTDIAIAESQAHTENKKRDKTAKQALAKAEFSS